MARTNLRADMPLVTEFIDAVREVFGRAAVDAAIRAGLEGQPTFWARENGFEVGVRAPDTGVPVSQMVIGPLRATVGNPPKGQP